MSYRQSTCLGWGCRYELEELEGKGKDCESYGSDSEAGVWKLDIISYVQWLVIFGGSKGSRCIKLRVGINLDDCDRSIPSKRQKEVHWHKLSYSVRHSVPIKEALIS